MGLRTMILVILTAILVVSDAATLQNRNGHDRHVRRAGFGFFNPFGSIDDSERVPSQVKPGVELVKKVTYVDVDDEEEAAVANKGVTKVTSIIDDDKSAVLSGGITKVSSTIDSGAGQINTRFPGFIQDLASEFDIKAYFDGVAKGNGISVGQKGVIIKTDGGYLYKGDDGKIYIVKYITDENDYKNQGSHLQTAFSIPDEILKVVGEINAKVATIGTDINPNAELPNIGIGSGSSSLKVSGDEKPETELVKKVTYVNENDGETAAVNGGAAKVTSAIDSGAGQINVRFPGYVQEFASAFNIKAYFDGVAKGTAVSIGPKYAVIKTDGGYLYKGDDGKIYMVKYITDENEYKNLESHLQTQYPIPEEVLKIIEQIIAKETTAGSGTSPANVELPDVGVRSGSSTLDISGDKKPETELVRKVTYVNVDDDDKSTTVNGGITKVTSTIDSGTSQINTRFPGYVQEFAGALDTKTYFDGVAKGNAISIGSKYAIIKTDGGYLYKGDDGKIYMVKYISDENEYKNEGSHLQGNYPIPDDILKIIKQIAKETIDDSSTSPANVEIPDVGVKSGVSSLEISGDEKPETELVNKVTYINVDDDDVATIAKGGAITITPTVDSGIGQIKTRFPGFIQEFANEFDIQIYFDGVAKGSGIPIGQKSVIIKTDSGYLYKGDDGRIYIVKYVIDENEYKNQGSHLLTHYPIPDEIVKVIQKIITNEGAVSGIRQVDEDLPDIGTRSGSSSLEKSSDKEPETELVKKVTYVNVDDDDKSATVSEGITKVTSTIDSSTDQIKTRFPGYIQKLGSEYDIETYFDGVARGSGISIGQKGVIIKTVGGYLYKGDDGRIYVVKYITDENEYKNQVSLSQTSFVIPKEILKVITQIVDIETAAGFDTNNANVNLPDYGVGSGSSTLEGSFDKRPESEIVEKVTYVNVDDGDKSALVNGGITKITSTVDSGTGQINTQFPGFIQEFASEFDIKTYIDGVARGSGISIGEKYIIIKTDGGYLYKGEDERIYIVKYFKDESEFKNQGSHFQTQLPIPYAILKVLEQIIAREATFDSSTSQVNSGLFVYVKEFANDYEIQQYYNGLAEGSGISIGQKDVVIKTNDGYLYKGDDGRIYIVKYTKNINYFDSQGSYSTAQIPDNILKILEHITTKEVTVGSGTGQANVEIPNVGVVSGSGSHGSIGSKFGEIVHNAVKVGSTGFANLFGSGASRGTNNFRIDNDKSNYSSRNDEDNKNKASVSSVSSSTSGSSFDQGFHEKEQSSSYADQDSKNKFNNFGLNIQTGIQPVQNKQDKLHDQSRLGITGYQPSSGIPNPVFQVSGSLNGNSAYDSAIRSGSNSFTTFQTSNVNAFENKFQKPKSGSYTLTSPLYPAFRVIDNRPQQSSYPGFKSDSFESSQETNFPTRISNNLHLNSPKVYTQSGYQDSTSISSYPSSISKFSTIFYQPVSSQSSLSQPGQNSFNRSQIGSILQPTQVASSTGSNIDKHFTTQNNLLSSLGQNTEANRVQLLNAQNHNNIYDHSYPTKTIYHFDQKPHIPQTQFQMGIHQTGSGFDETQAEFSSSKLGTERSQSSLSSYDSNDGTLKGQFVKTTQFDMKPFGTLQNAGFGFSQAKIGNTFEAQHNQNSQTGIGTFTKDIPQVQPNSQYTHSSSLSYSAYKDQIVPATQLGVKSNSSFERTRSSNLHNIAGRPFEPQNRQNTYNGVNFSSTNSQDQFTIQLNEKPFGSQFNQTSFKQSQYSPSIEFQVTGMPETKGTASQTSSAFVQNHSKASITESQFDKAQFNSASNSLNSEKSQFTQNGSRFYNSGAYSGQPLQSTQYNTDRTSELQSTQHLNNDGVNPFITTSQVQLTSQYVKKPFVSTSVGNSFQQSQYSPSTSSNSLPSKGQHVQTTNTVVKPFVSSLNKETKFSQAQVENNHSVHYGVGVFSSNISQGPSIFQNGIKAIVSQSTPSSFQQPQYSSSTDTKFGQKTGTTGTVSHTSLILEQNPNVTILIGSNEKNKAEILYSSSNKGKPKTSTQSSLFYNNGAYNGQTLQTPQYNISSGTSGLQNTQKIYNGGVNPSIMTPQVKVTSQYVKKPFVSTSTGNSFQQSQFSPTTSSHNSLNIGKSQSTQSSSSLNYAPSKGQYVQTTSFAVKPLNSSQNTKVSLSQGTLSHTSLVFGQNPTATLQTVPGHEKDKSGSFYGSSSKDKSSSLTFDGAYNGETLQKTQFNTGSTYGPQKTQNFYKVNVTPSAAIPYGHFTSDYSKKPFESPSTPTSFKQSQFISSTGVQFKQSLEPMRILAKTSSLFEQNSTGTLQTGSGLENIQSGFSSSSSNNKNSQSIQTSSLSYNDGYNDQTTQVGSTPFISSGRVGDSSSKNKVDTKFNSQNQPNTYNIVGIPSTITSDDQPNSQDNIKSLVQNSFHQSQFSPSTGSRDSQNPGPKGSIAQTFSIFRQNLSGMSQTGTEHDKIWLGSSSTSLNTENLQSTHNSSSFNNGQSKDQSVQTIHFDFRPIVASQSIEFSSLQSQVGNTFGSQTNQNSHNGVETFSSDTFLVQNESQYIKKPQGSQSSQTSSQQSVYGLSTGTKIAEKSETTSILSQPSVVFGQPPTVSLQTGSGYQRVQSESPYSSSSNEKLKSTQSDSLSYDGVYSDTVQKTPFSLTPTQNTVTSKDPSVQITQFAAKPIGPIQGQGFTHSQAHVGNGFVIEQNQNSHSSLGTFSLNIPQIQSISQHDKNLIGLSLPHGSSQRSQYSSATGYILGQNQEIPESLSHTFSVLEQKPIETSQNSRFGSSFSSINSEKSHSTQSSSFTYNGAHKDQSVQTNQFGVKQNQFGSLFQSPYDPISHNNEDIVSSVPLLVHAISQNSKQPSGAQSTQSSFKKSQFSSSTGFQFGSKPKETAETLSQTSSIFEQKPVIESRFGSQIDKTTQNNVGIVSTSTPKLQSNIQDNKSLVLQSTQNSLKPHLSSSTGFIIGQKAGTTGAISKTSLVSNPNLTGTSQMAMGEEKAQFGLSRSLLNSGKSQFTQSSSTRFGVKPFGSTQNARYSFPKTQLGNTFETQTNPDADNKKTTNNTSYVVINFPKEKFTFGSHSIQKSFQQPRYNSPTVSKFGQRPISTGTLSQTSATFAHKPTPTIQETQLGSTFRSLNRTKSKSIQNTYPSSDSKFNDKSVKTVPYTFKPSISSQRTGFSFSQNKFGSSVVSRFSHKPETSGTVSQTFPVFGQTALGSSQIRFDFGKPRYESSSSLLHREKSQSAQTPLPLSNIVSKGTSQTAGSTVSKTQFNISAGSQYAKNSTGLQSTQGSRQVSALVQETQPQRVSGQTHSALVGQKSFGNSQLSQSGLSLVSQSYQKPQSTLSGKSLSTTKSQSPEYKRLNSTQTPFQSPFSLTTRQNSGGSRTSSVHSKSLSDTKTSPQNIGSVSTQTVQKQSNILGRTQSTHLSGITRQAKTSISGVQIPISVPEKDSWQSTFVSKAEYFEKTRNPPTFDVKTGYHY